jgi:D-methionine transport system ATP-binding protein
VESAQLLTFKNVSKILTSNGKEVRALDSLTFSLNRGEIYGLIGGSGAGKSTLTRLVLGLIKTTSGEIFFDGIPLNSEGRRNISPVFQDFNLLESKTLLENVSFPLMIRGEKNAVSKAKELISIVGLDDKLHYYPAQLSGGQKQRVAVARALTLNPKLLLCDEPTSSLDPENTTAILELLSKVNQQLGLTILLISHEMDVVKNLCHRVGVLDAGKLVEEGEIEALIAHPQHPVTLSYLEPFNTRSFKKYFKDHKEDLWRLCFLGESATRPLVAQLVSQFSVKLNILMGSIDFVRDQLVGTLVVEAEGVQKAEAKKWLRAQGVQIEEVNHVPS